MDMFIAAGFAQRALRFGGGWGPAKLSGDSISHMFEVAKAIPEFMGEFIEKGLILDAPDHWQVIPMEYGHLAHIELMFFFDRTLPNWGSIPLAFMQKSAQTDIRHGYHAAMPPHRESLIEQTGPLYSNFHVWAMKIKKAFDPNMASNPMP
jgi:hypothetical protein